MFRATLLSLLLATSLNAANVRYELLNEPAKQGGKDVIGYVVVRTSGSGLPARGFVSTDNILDWQVKCDGKTISMSTANRETKGVSMVNQGFGNNLVATQHGLYLQGYGEYPNGSWIEFENVIGGTPPYTETTKLKIQTRSVRNEQTVSGRRIVVWEDMIEKYFSSGRSPNWNRSFHSITPAVQMPLVYSNYVQIADNPTLVGEVNPVPPTPVDPVTPPSPVDPEPVDPIADLQQLKAKRNQLIQELYYVQQLLKQLEN